MAYWLALMLALPLVAVRERSQANASALVPRSLANSRGCGTVTFTVAAA